MITAGEILAQSLLQLERDIHAVVITSAYNKALEEAPDSSPFHRNQVRPALVRSHVALGIAGRAGRCTGMDEDGGYQAPRPC